MKRIISTLALLLAFGAAVHAQSLDDATLAKRETRKNMTIKEWNTDARSKTRVLDHVTTYDALGRKIEEIEYSSYGQKYRETFEYGEDDRIVKEVRYDENNKPSVIYRYEYNSDGTKKRQFKYSPNGKLQTTKVFEYIINEK